jgi:hypothetical protein
MVKKLLLKLALKNDEILYIIEAIYQTNLSRLNFTDELFLFKINIYRKLKWYSYNVKLFIEKVNG